MSQAPAYSSGRLPPSAYDNDFLNEAHFLCILVYKYPSDDSSLYAGDYL